MSRPDPSTSPALTAEGQDLCERMMPLARGIAREFPRVIDAESEAFLALCVAVRDWFALTPRYGSPEPFAARAVRNWLISEARKNAPPTSAAEGDGDEAPRPARFFTFREG